MSKIDIALYRVALQKLNREDTRYEALRKHVIRVTECGSPGKVDRTIRGLLRNGWAIKLGPKGSQTSYRITEKGKLFLQSLQSNL